jgi:hypothetical protein
MSNLTRERQQKVAAHSGSNQELLWLFAELRASFETIVGVQFVQDVYGDADNAQLMMRQSAEERSLQVCSYALLFGPLRGGSS